MFGLSDSEMAFVGGAAFAYLFHRIDQKEFIRLVDEREVSERVLQFLRSDGYVLKNCKLYAWAFYKYRRGRGPEPDPVAFGITKEVRGKFIVKKRDEEFLSRLNLKHLPMKFEAFSLEDYDGLIEGIVHGDNLGQYIGKFISKKMTFLIRSFGVDRAELESDLTYAAMRAIHHTYPRFESLLHMENVAKSAIHNTGQSLITYHTSPGRQRLFVDQNGDYQSRRVADDTQLVNVKAPEGYLAHARDSLETLVKLSKNMREDVQRFLLCCAGHFDQGFSEFLRDDNSAVIDGMAYSRYIRKAKKYFGFTDKQVDDLFVKLKSHLS
jgi:hypothetical protein